MNQNRDILEEFAGVELGDVRLERRLVSMVKGLSTEPSLSLPRSMNSDAELEACYRFINNEAISVEALASPHQRQTVRRASQYDEVWVCHDTTSFRFCDDDTRRGLGPLLNKQGARGFFAHVSLVMAPVRQHTEPLGVLGHQTFVRSEHKVSAKQTEAMACESERWVQGVSAADKQLARHVQAIHVMDREADSYEVLAGMIAAGRRFVVRARHDRSTDSKLKLSEVLGSLEGRAQREVLLSKRQDKGRAPRTRRLHPARHVRTATLSFRASTVRIQRPKSVDRTLPDELKLHVVHVVEVEPAEGQTAVEWKLFSTEPVSRIEQVLRIVDIYRARWCIEELFKALKTGCEFEKKQLRSYDALCRMLAIYWPVAWRLLRMRTLCHARADAPATEVISAVQFQILRTLSKRVKLSTDATVQQVLYAVAALGGHLKRNGPPGWLTLGRGYDRLLNYELGFLIAVSLQNQSTLDFSVPTYDQP